MGGRGKKKRRRFPQEEIWRFLMRPNSCECKLHSCLALSLKKASKRSVTADLPCRNTNTVTQTQRRTDGSRRERGRRRLGGQREILYKEQKPKEKRENNKLLLFLVVPSLEIANKYTQGYVRNHIV